MNLRNAFLSKMVLLAVFSSSLSLYAGEGEVGMDSHHQSGHMYYGSFSAAEIAKLEAAVYNNPHSAINQLVQLANKQLSSEDNGMKNFAITVKYSNSLSADNTTSLDLVSLDPTKVTMQLTVHELAMKNPYFLLDTLIEIRNLYNLDNISISEAKPIYGKAHPSHHHTSIINYEYSNIILNKQLGLPSSHELNIVQDNLYKESITPMELIELKANASAGSVFAQRRLQEMKNNNFILIKHGLGSFLPINKLSLENKNKFLQEYAIAKGINIIASDSYEVALKKVIDGIDLRNKQKIDTLNALAKKTYQQQVHSYKEKAPIREEVVQGTALNEMIKANDREGVAKAMAKMLPWEIMEPTEKVFWSDFIDAIRHPDYSNAKILFRGIDKDEKFQAVTDKKGNIIGGGLLSKRLTAGSGSHFFKLKGLPETFETFGTYGVNVQKRVSPLSQPHTLTKMMLNHANNPAGSPFISLSYSLDTAYSFGAGKPIQAKDQADYNTQLSKIIKTNAAGAIATIRIDPRRLLINSVSGFASEREVLASMFIFPDEVIHLERGANINSIVGGKFNRNPAVTVEQYYERARQAVLQKTGIVLPAKKSEIDSSKHFIGGLKEMEKLFNRVSSDKINKCERLFK